MPTARTRRAPPADWRPRTRLESFTDWHERTLKQWESEAGMRVIRWRDGSTAHHVSSIIHPKRLRRLQREGVKLVFDASQMGAGKTEAMARCAPHFQMTSIVNRRSLATNHAARLDAWEYDDAGDDGERDPETGRATRLQIAWNVASEERLVITIQGMHHAENRDYGSGSLLFVDEVLGVFESLSTQIPASLRGKERRAAVAAAQRVPLQFAELLRACRQSGIAYLADAGLTVEDARRIAFRLGVSLDQVLFIQDERTRDRGEAWRYMGENELFDEILRRCAQSRDFPGQTKVQFFSQSETAPRALAEKAEAEGHSALLITAKTKGTRRVREYMRDPAGHAYDLVAASTSLESGFSLDVTPEGTAAKTVALLVDPHPQSGGARSSLQQAGRVRGKPGFIFAFKGGRAPRPKEHLRVAQEAEEQAIRLHPEVRVYNESSGEIDTRWILAQRMIALNTGMVVEARGESWAGGLQAFVTKLWEVGYIVEPAGPHGDSTTAADARQASKDREIQDVLEYARLVEAGREDELGEHHEAVKGKYEAVREALGGWSRLDEESARWALKSQANLSAVTLALDIASGAATVDRNRAADRYEYERETPVSSLTQSAHRLELAHEALIAAGVDLGNLGSFRVAAHELQAFMAFVERRRQDFLDLLGWRPGRGVSLVRSGNTLKAFLARCGIDLTAHDTNTSKRATTYTARWSPAVARTLKRNKLRPQRVEVSPSAGLVSPPSNLRTRPGFEAAVRGYLERPEAERLGTRDAEGQAWQAVMLGKLRYLRDGDELPPLEIRDHRDGRRITSWAQQVPRALRPFIECSISGWVLIDCDISSCHLRIAAEECGCQALREDLDAKTVPGTKVQRLAWLNGSSSLDPGLLEELDARYPEIAAVVAKARGKGRKRERSALARRWQEVESEAMRTCRKELRKLEIQEVLPMHDGVLVAAPREHAGEVAALVARTLGGALAQQFWKDAPVPTHYSVGWDEGWPVS